MDNMDMDLNKKIFKFYFSNIAKNKDRKDVNVYGYWDEKEENEIDIVYVNNMCEEGLISYGTIGTYAHSIGLVVDGKPLRVEFLGMAHQEDEFFPHMLSTCAFNIINSHYRCEPGMVYPDVVKMYYPNVNMKHIYLTSPFIWDGEYTLDIGPYIVTFLQAIYISDSEYEYIRKNGSDNFEDILEKANVDILDLNRPSVV